MFQIDHLGIAVKSLAAAKSIYEKLGLTVSPEETVENEKVRVVMVPVGESRLELMEATSDDSAIAKFIAKRGEGLHHVSLRVSGLDAVVAKLKQEGVRLVSEEIKTGAGGHRYVFVHPQSAGGVLLELVDSSHESSAILLAIDTSGKNGSLALAHVSPGQSEVGVIETVPLAGGTFSAQLVPQISALLTKHEYTKSDLAGFAVVSGPGSFTGLRVGLAAIKALAEVLDKPIAAVSLLELVARSSQERSDSHPYRILAALDAGRGEIYVGDYELDDQKGGDNETGKRDPYLRMHSERLLTRVEFLAEAQGKSVVTPDATVAEMLRAAAIPYERIDYPSSAVIARLGWERIQRGQIVRPENLEANYIRRSDAEIFSHPKS